MDRVFIKPTSREILIKDSLKEGYFDIYSYDYPNDEIKRKLGSLYIIGNVSQSSAPQDTNDSEAQAASDNTPDVAYMVNLVASLAKREYYSKPNLLPKEAFTATLKRINEIVEEFFKNKGTKVNIGIFAVAGEEMHVSKLGKFKIILSRKNELIDVFNNILLFDKEHIEEKEFSNIISGKIHSGDKILAFYPSKFITSREKSIKDHFLKLTWIDFIEKINGIKEGRANVACAALYIDLHKVKVGAIAPRPQPKELREAPMIAEDVQLASMDNKEPKASMAIEVDEPKLPPGDVHNKKPEAKHLPPLEQPQEIPKIIPSEFSSAKKENIFEKLASRVHSFRKDVPYGRIGKSPMFHFKKQALIVAPVVLFVAISGWLAKTYIFVSAEVKEQRKLAKQLDADIKLAQEKVDGKDSLSARQLLFGSLSNSFSSSKNDELLGLLDRADGAVAANPVLVDKLPDDVVEKTKALDNEEQKVKSGKYNISGQALSMDIYQGNLYVLTSNNIFKVIDATKGSLTTVAWLKTGVTPPAESSLITVDGNVFTLNKSGTITKYYKGGVEKEFNTSISSTDSVMLTAKDTPGLYIINKRLGRIYVIDKENGSIIKVIKIGNTESLAAVYLDDKGIVYLSTQDDKIWRIE